MNLIYRYLFIAICLSLFACHKDDDSSQNALQENISTNKWIKNQMDYCYLWNTNIPTSVNYSLAPEAFFESLLYKSEDRFSWIQNAKDLEGMLNGVQVATGMELSLFLMAPGSNDLIAQVVYVFPGSPASEQGVIRGDLFRVVNGQSLNLDNYTSLLFGGTSSTMSVTLLTYTNGQLLTKRVVSLIPRQIVEDPIMLDSIYDFSGSKVGYFAYKNFIPDPGDVTEIYDNKLIDVFSRFKNAGVGSVVLDLRFNTGGAVSSAVKLASLLVKNASSQNIFFKTKYNSLVTQDIIAAYGSTYFDTYFEDQPNNIGNTLQNLIVLTSNRTASASELVIYGLKPYMNVILVGDKTYGKNVGSVTVTDETGAISWGLQPIVAKMYNVNDQSDYSNGINVDYEVLDNSLELYPLGNCNEPLLKYALQNVLHFDLTSRLAPKSNLKSSSQMELFTHYEVFPINKNTLILNR